MLCIYNKHTRPDFNLATEEYFLKNFNEDIFMLYRNKASIIVGKHQNALAEINLGFIKGNNIPVIRRLSGGGTVFHDLGNVNYTFIKSGEEGKLVDFRRYTAPIIEVLKSLGIEAKYEGRSDLTIDSRKFSGNAEHVWKNKVLHHGTLLYNANLQHLTEALQVNPLKYMDKAVKSVRSQVTNISSHLAEKIDIENFIELVMDHVSTAQPDTKPYFLTREDELKIMHLVETKYSKWTWNYGHSPKYSILQQFLCRGGMLEAYLVVAQGIIESVTFNDDFPVHLDFSVIEQALTGCAHREEAIRDTLEMLKMDSIFTYISLNELCLGLF